MYPWCHVPIGPHLTPAHFSVGICPATATASSTRAAEEVLPVAVVVAGNMASLEKLILPSLTNMCSIHPSYQVESVLSGWAFVYLFGRCLIFLVDSCFLWILVDDHALFG